ncbi:GNAT family N-acetyltransferase [Leuconostoc gelidum subsp. gelidum]|uniref:GNAT family N-acetyltransferase n=1 Tax=Leuconostoc gelidum subsp. gelidum TaxID=1607839 RepID=A0AB35G0J9_LEUGE|nr:GNAT family N-acetyltransferase [Leuconostoc gelidum]MBZ5963868.1 GNAT family N-acetyltransferase [Leuconostoc gelidum subsp. gelidum]MBZ5975288.1 GNAT family N-acetyltransferase [Leuconostoc gelidum subsp. gelidum]MBZ5976541.1 GNAT family N-acetyltransferase [Leuconostoc gelidum subsp. gelidum]MBZ5985553.1 GNAT family N-acetyltransferase [Leuconostoc gelidum subsp. gelidum]MBZ6000523.1 GNAT family N-acetyltransferase [Leuconostoc gelidum subsp. gelidum]
MIFDKAKPITFSLEEASLTRATAWQSLIQNLMSETDTFLVASVRDGQIVVEEDTNEPAITLLLIAEQQNDTLPVGIASIENGEIGMAILKDFQGAGLGKTLMVALLDWAEMVNLEKVWLDVQTDNLVATHLYDKFEFEKVGSEVNLTLPNGRVTKLQRMVKFLVKENTSL